MSYLAIARKYRPATFDGIIGQDHVTRTLKNALQRGRIHHAFLFTGARGVGKTTAARALARSLNCEQGPTAEPCGECLSCREITGGMSPDLIEIDGASNNSVDDIRELRETVRYAPTHGKWKIYLIDEVHMLSKGAFNALLKTLEEPPPHVVFIFATTEPNRIPDTILSRVQRFDFKRIPVAAVAGRLRALATSEGVSLSDNALRMIARAGEGSMRDAESLLDRIISFGGEEVTDDEVAQTLGLIDRSLLYDTLQGLIEGRPEQALDAIDQVYRYGYELSQFTAELLEVVRNATFLRLSEQARAHVDLAPGDLARLDALSDEVDPEVLTRVFAALLDVHDQVSRASRPRIVLEMAIARLATIRPLEPIGALLGRLEQVERRLRQGGSGAPTSGYRTAGGRPRASAPAPRRAPRAAEPKVRTPPPSAARKKPEPPPVPKAEPPAEAAPAPDPRPEPPPLDPEPPAAQAEESAPEPAPSDPWQAVLAAAAGLSGERDIQQAEIEDEDEDGVLRIVVPTVKAKAAVRRLLGRSKVASALKRGYPETSPEVVVRTQADAEDPQAILRKKALDDPAIRRIVDKLGAELTDVTPLDDGETP